jgi:hypothetical protein
MVPRVLVAGRAGGAAEALLDGAAQPELIASRVPDHARSIQGPCPRGSIDCSDGCRFDSSSRSVLEGLLFVAGGICVPKTLGTGEMWTPADNSIEVFDLRVPTDEWPTRFCALPAPPSVAMLCAAAGRVFSCSTTGPNGMLVF